MLPCSVWYIIKAGDERRYATPTPPSEEWAEALKKQGFKIVRVDFELPAEVLRDPALARVHGNAREFGEFGDGSRADPSS